MAASSTSYPAPFSQNLKGAVFIFLLGLVAIIMAAIVWPSLLPAAKVPTDHADQRHGKEQFKPELIRNCIALGLFYEYVGTEGTPSDGKIARICQLAVNRFGVQISKLVDGNPEEITSFYNTLSRMKNILERDGYIPAPSSAPLP